MSHEMLNEYTNGSAYHEINGNGNVIDSEISLTSSDISKLIYDQNSGTGTSTSIIGLDAYRSLISPTRASGFYDQDRIKILNSHFSDYLNEKKIKYLDYYSMEQLFNVFSDFRIDFLIGDTFGYRNQVIVVDNDGVHILIDRALTSFIRNNRTKNNVILVTEIDNKFYFKPLSFVQRYLSIKDQDRRKQGKRKASYFFMQLFNKEGDLNYLFLFDEMINLESDEYGNKINPMTNDQLLSHKVNKKLLMKTIKI